MKIETIEKLTPSTSVKGTRSLLRHVGFYKRFIKYFSTISKPLSSLLMHEVPFFFEEICMIAFTTLKDKLTSTPIVIFELMCDASDYAVGLF